MLDWLLENREGDLCETGEPEARRTWSGTGELENDQPHISGLQNPFFFCTTLLSECHRLITRQHMARGSISLYLRSTKRILIWRYCPWNPPSPSRRFPFLLEEVKLIRLILSHVGYSFSSLTRGRYPFFKY